jgi:hypothetical protein
MDAEVKAEQLEKRLEKDGWHGPPQLNPKGRRTRKGRLNQKTLQQLDKLTKDLATGKMPLDVMLEHMRFAQDKAHELTKTFIERTNAEIPRGDPKALVACLEQVRDLFEELRAWRTLALDAATRAAPYCHPKLNAIAMKINDPEGTRSIVDINLVAATGAAVDNVINHDPTEGLPDNGTPPPDNGTPPPDNGTIPHDNGTTPEAPVDSPVTDADTAEIGSESGKSG